MIIIFKVYKTIPWISIQSIGLSISHWVGRNEYVVYFTDILKLLGSHLCPGTILDYLATKTIVNCRVDQCKIDAPLLIWLLTHQILLIPNAKRSLVREIHWRINCTSIVTFKFASLGERIEDSGELLLTDRVIKVLVV